MTEYISFVNAINTITKSRLLRDNKFELIEAFQNIPAADVRPVVFCRDCQNSYEWANVDGDSYRYCGYLRSRWNHDTDRMVDDDDFCKWGRKREES